MSDQCRICGEWTYLSGRHKCPPRWLVWDPDQGETPADASPVYATDGQAAAEKYQEQSEANACEYTCMEGGEVSLHILPDELTAVEDVQVFVVTGESVPQYNASALRRQPERTPYRVSTFHKADGQWTVKLEDLAGEEAGGVVLTEDQGPPPDRGVYVHAVGDIGSPGLVLSWKDERSRLPREVTFAAATVTEDSPTKLHELVCARCKKPITKGQAYAANVALPDGETAPVHGTCMS